MENAQIRSHRREKDQRHKAKPSTMNGGFGGGAGGGSGGLRRVSMPPPRAALKDDEEPSLILFKEMHRQDKDRTVSLLQPVSDEFEATGGNHQLYKMASVKKGFGYEFLGDNGKNDYDWLKTPPATPLFPSLEMEANAPELVVQREIPIIQSLSRFSALNVSSMPAKLSSTMANSPKPKAPPLSLTKSTDSFGEKPAAHLSGKANKTKPTPGSQNDTNTNKNRFSKPINYQLQQQQKELSKTTRPLDPKPRPISRGRAVSQARSLTIPSDQTKKISESGKFETPTTKDPKHQQKRSTSALRARYGIHQTVPSIRNQEIIKSSKPADHETPPNLKTTVDPQRGQNRSTSAVRARYGTHQAVASTQNQEKKGENANNIAKETSRRLASCSPNVTRGRKQVVHTKEEAVGSGFAATTASKMQSTNGSQVPGSRMVDKFMNARRSATPGGKAEIATMNPKSRDGSANEGLGFGRRFVS